MGSAFSASLTACSIPTHPNYVQQPGGWQSAAAQTFTTCSYVYHSCPGNLVQTRLTRHQSAVSRAQADASESLGNSIGTNLIKSDDKTIVLRERYLYI